jgi:hypothetical protein
MKIENKKLAATAGVAGTFNIENSLIWLLDRIMDIVLAYKDAITLILSSI